MCDPGTLLSVALTATGLMTAAAIAIGVAVALNGSFFGAGGAPVPMGIAAGASAAAAALLFGATEALESYFNCAGRPPECELLYETTKAHLFYLAGLLTAQAIASAAVAAVAWIPWAAQPAMMIILATLVGAIVSVGALSTAIPLLIACVSSSSVGATPDPLVIAIGIGVVVAMGVGYVVARNNSAGGVQAATKGN